MKTIAFAFIPVAGANDLKGRLRERTAIFEASASSAVAELSKPEHEPDGCQFWTWFIDNPRSQSRK